MKKNAIVQTVSFSQAVSKGAKRVKSAKKKKKKTALISVDMNLETLKKRVREAKSGCMTSVLRCDPASRGQSWPRHSSIG